MSQLAEELEIVVSGRVVEYFTMLALKFGLRHVEANGRLNECGAALEKTEMICAAYVCI